MDISHTYNYKHTDTNTHEPIEMIIAASTVDENKQTIVDTIINA